MAVSQSVLVYSKYRHDLPKFEKLLSQALPDIEVNCADTPENADVTLLAKQLSGRNHHSKVAYGTEAGLFSNAGVPTVVIGPGSIDQAHKADEFIAVSELEKCGRFLGRLIEHCAR